MKLFNPVLSLSWLLTLALALPSELTLETLGKRAVCNADDCLRALRASTLSAPTASLFCQSYLIANRATITATVATTTVTPTVQTVTVTTGTTTTTIATPCGNSVTTVAPVKRGLSSVVTPFSVSVSASCKPTAGAPSRIASACSCYLGSSVAPTSELVTLTLTASQSVMTITTSFASTATISICTSASANNVPDVESSTTTSTTSTTTSTTSTTTSTTESKTTATTDSTSSTASSASASDPTTSSSSTTSSSTTSSSTTSSSTTSSSTTSSSTTSSSTTSSSTTSSSTTTTTTSSSASTTDVTTTSTSLTSSTSAASLAQSTFYIKVDTATLTSQYIYTKLVILNQFQTWWTTQLTPDITLAEKFAIDQTSKQLYSVTKTSPIYAWAHFMEVDFGEQLWGPPLYMTKEWNARKNDVPNNPYKGTTWSRQTCSMDNANQLSCHQINVDSGYIVDLHLWEYCPGAPTLEFNAVHHCDSATLTAVPIDS